MKKFGILLSTTILAISLPFSSMIAHAEEIDNEIILEGENLSFDKGEVSPLVATSVITTILKKLAMPLLKLVGGIPLSGTDGVVIDQGRGVYYVKYGSITFNSGNVVSHAFKELVVTGQDTMRFMIQHNNFLFQGSPLAVGVFDKSNPTKPLIEKSLKSGNYFDYTFPGGYETQYNNYYISLSTGDKASWEPSMYYTVVDKPCTGTCPAPASNPSPQLSLNNVDISSNAILYNDRYLYLNNDTSVKSTSNNLTSTFSNNLSDVSEGLTFNQLYGEFYDSSTNTLTNQTKSLLPNTTVHVQDNITDIAYNVENDYTEIKFASDYSNIEYHSAYFKGNLTSEYSIGDTLALKFKLITIAKTKGQVFVDLDYNQYYDNNSDYPTIDEFLD